LRGETDVSAMSVYGDKKTLIVDLGNGLKRHYNFFKKSSGKLHFKISKEERQSGNIRYYDYLKESSSIPKRIWTTNKNNSVTLNWLDFNFGKFDYTISASNRSS
jgi:pantothenate kinase